MAESTKVRLDKYLWAIRLFKTRTQAATAIDAGKVKYHGAPVKSSRIVGVGDEYDIKTEARKWIIEVTAVLDTRVQYSEAIKHYIDKTPPEIITAQKSAFVFHTGKRLSKMGRPTKKDRRDMESFMD
jgi:ribosome-associated heat shock protein Hsp15